MLICRCDEDKAKLMDIADKVILVTTQNDASVYATNLLVSNINGANADKYMFICNDFKKEEENALISPKHVAKFAVSDYVDHFEHYDDLSPTDFAKCGKHSENIISGHLGRAEEMNRDNAIIILNIKKRNFVR